MDTLIVPDRIKHSVDSEGMEFVQDKITIFQESLCRTIIEETGYKDAFKIIVVEYKTFKNTDNEAVEIKCCDKIIGLVYTTRTAFNNAETVFCAYTDILPYIKERIKELKEFSD